MRPTFEATLGKIKTEDAEFFGALVKTTQVRASHNSFNSFHIDAAPLAGFTIQGHEPCPPNTIEV